MTINNAGNNTPGIAIVLAIIGLISAIAVALINNWPIQQPSPPTVQPQTATPQCQEGRLSSWDNQTSEPFQEISINRSPVRPGYITASLWWKGRISIANSASIRNVNSPSRPGDTEIWFTVLPKIQKIHFRNSPGGMAWHHCGYTFNQAQEEDDKDAAGRAKERPDLNIWRVNLPEGLRDPEIRKLVVCITPAQEDIIDCR